MPDGAHLACLPVSAHAPATLDVSRLVACLAGRRVLIMGNSIARHWAFVLAEMLESRGERSAAHSFSPFCGTHGWCDTRPRSRIDRGEEKRRCGASTLGRSGDMFACRFRAGRNTTITFGHEHRVWPENGTIERDWAALRPDLAIFNMGSSDIFEAERSPRWERIQRAEAPRLAQWLRGEALRGRSSFYWRTSTPLCPGDFMKCGGPAAPQKVIAARLMPEYSRSCNAYRTTQESIRASNALILRRLCGAADAERILRPEPTPQLTPSAGAPRLNVIDGFGWVGAPAACPAYDDMIHHSVLAWEHVGRTMAHYCAAS